MKNKILIFLLTVIATLIPFVGVNAANNGNTNDYAWGEQSGYISLNGSGATPDYGVTVASAQLTGYAWSELTGWISFNCSNTGSCATVNYSVTNDGSGNLSGYAWSELAGWISFDDSGAGNLYQATVSQGGGLTAMPGASYSVT